jgi:hypothetical protein
MKKIFIGSSTQSLNVANAVQATLNSLLNSIKKDFHIKVWNQNVFGLNKTFIETLFMAADKKYDFAIFIFSPDDIKMIGEEAFFEARSNVIFEYGLFTGRLNRDKVFVVSPSDCEKFIIPSDILGVTLAQYEYEKTKDVDNENLEEIVQDACLKIKSAIEIVKPSKVNTILGYYSTPREHYKIANSIMKEIDDIDEIILIQKTSSLILGYEQGDNDEEEFINKIFSCMDKSKKIYHVTNMEKTQRKIKNDTSLINKYTKTLHNLYENKTILPFRKSKKNENIAPILLFKFKNQNRAIEGIILSPTSTINFCIHMKGEMMQNYWDNHLKYFHDNCEKISVTEINNKI